tara:strand:+ start:4863 stop:5573 length:711 start_codon:yes stop_codon:yes gene_type:complete
LSWQYIKYYKKNNLAHVEFDNGSKKNSFNLIMREEIKEVINAISIDDDIKVLIFSSNSENFSSGADLSEFNTFPSIIKSNQIAKYKNLWIDLYQFKKPIISLTKGWTIGSGFELLMLSDFVFAHTSTKFLMPEVQWSLLPISGGTQTFVNKIKNLYVKEILLFSETIDVYKALKIGLINYISEDYSELSNQVFKYAEKISLIDITRLIKIKKLLNFSTEKNIYFGKRLEEIYSRSL